MPRRPYPFTSPQQRQAAYDFFTSKLAHVHSAQLLARGRRPLSSPVMRAATQYTIRELTTPSSAAPGYMLRNTRARFMKKSSNIQRFVHMWVGRIAADRAWGHIDKPRTRRQRKVHIEDDESAAVARQVHMDCYHSNVHVDPEVLRVSISDSSAHTCTRTPTHARRACDAQIKHRGWKLYMYVAVNWHTGAFHLATGTGMPRAACTAQRSCAETPPIRQPLMTSPRKPPTSTR